MQAECLAGAAPAWRPVDGSLVFADVSGFTPLTERLSRAGKVGAEQLTETLNAVFSALLDVAEHLGGDCLKFGGDALLLLFRGADHQRRAAAAAASMQQALQALRRGGGSIGLAGLGISMGVHSGEVHAFAVGSTHRDLLVAGPAVSRTLQLEARAERGQILIDVATAAALAPRDVDAVDTGAMLLRRRPAVDVASVPEPTDDVGDVTTGVPAPVRDHLDGKRHHGEHRLAAVGFLKYGGVDELLAAQGPHAVAGALDQLVGLAQAACEELGVTFVASDVDVDGGKLVLTAGVPSAADDDGDRLLLALHRVVEDARPLPLRTRAGASFGRIFAVDLGGDRRRTFTVMGDAVNLAARVMGHAGWGDVLATDGVLERSRTEFHLERLPPFRVKGKSATVDAQRVGAPLGSRSAVDDLGPLVGRSAERQELLDACAAARAGRGVVVELSGEPGIGKSRLVAAAVASAPELARLSVAAGRYSLATPYHALRRGLRTLLGVAAEAPPDEVLAALRRAVERLQPDLEPWIPLLGVPVGLELPDTAATADLDPVLRPSVLHRAWGELLERLLAGPTVITVEDAHWLDAASSGLLVSLLGRLAQRPWAVIVARRPVPGGLELPEGLPVVRRQLTPLDRGQLLELAAVAAGPTTPPPGVLEQLVDRSGGNPLFLHELVAAWSAGSLHEVPETIEAVIAAQVDTLSPADRALLRHAAVLGAEVRPDQLAAVVGERVADVTGAVRRLGHFLHDAGDGSVRFAHSLLRDVAYEGLPFRTRRLMHERAGDILESSVDAPETMAELLSLHFERAGRWEEAWRYSQIAADRAHRNGASIEAAGFLERALSVAEHLEVGPSERAAVAEALGDDWELAGRYDRASAAYRRARSLVESHADQARLCRKLGFVRDHEGRYAAAQRWFRRGIAALDGVRDDAQARALRAEIATAMVSSRYRQGRHARALPLIRQAIDDAEASGAAAALAHAYFVYDELLIDRGQYHEARHSQHAAAIYEGLGDHRGAAAAYNEMGVTAYWLGRWDEAVRCYERAVEADRKAGAIVYNAIYLNNIGEIRSDQGRLREARQLLTEACELWTAGGWRAGTGWALSNLGRLAARDGRMDEARDRLEEARAVLADIGADGMLLETDARVMERSVLLGDHAHALGLAEELLERARRLDFPGVVAFVQRLEGYARCQAGDGDRALERIAESRAASRARGARFEAALGAEAAARVGEALSADPEVVAADRAEALEVLGTLGVVSTPSVPLPLR